MTNIILITSISIVVIVISTHISDTIRFCSATKWRAYNPKAFSEFKEREEN